MQKIKCIKCGEIIEFEEGLEVVECSNCNAKFKVAKREQKPKPPAKEVKKVEKPAPKKPKKKMKALTKVIISAVSVVLIAGIVVSTLFVIDSRAPANPKVYHRFLKSTFNGSYDGKNTPNDAYQVEIQKDTQTGEVLYSFVDIKLSATNSRNISEIWINFSDVYEDELTITMSKGYATTTWLLKEKTYTAKEIKADEDGWFRLYNDQSEGLNYNQSGFYGELKIGFSANVKVREIVILDTAKELLTTNVSKCTIGKKPTTAGVEGYVELGNKKEEAANVFGESSTCPFIPVKEE
ncbi:MAG: hypothetical protein J6V66_04520 [Clostridia bacterium]|nr:hypothetical protein [Clostridia bacterium]